MTELQKKLLNKEFANIDILDKDSGLLAILEKNTSLMPEEVKSEYTIYEENQRKKLKARKKKKANEKLKTKKINTLVDIFKENYPAENQKLFRELIVLFENLYPLDTNELFEDYAKKFYNLTKLNISDLYDNYKDFEEKTLKTACDSYKVANNNINIAITAILREIINQKAGRTEWSVQRSDLTTIVENIKLEELENRENLTKKSLNYLRCLKVAYFEKKGKNTAYYINLVEWFFNRKYNVANQTVLKELTPLLVAYIKSSKDYNIDDFFEIIDSVLGYVIQPYKNHNDNFALEKYLVDNLYEEIQIRVIDHTNTSKNIIKINNMDMHTNLIWIEPQNIVFGDEEKILEYRDMKAKLDYQTIPLNDILRVIIDKSGLPALAKVTSIYSTQHAYIKDDEHYYITNPKYIKDNIGGEYYKQDLKTIVLELPLSALEYFRLKPLAGMTIYATASEIIEFKQTIKLQKIKDIKETTIKGSHFYVIANETVDNATSIIMHVLSDVKIIAPFELIESVQKNISRFRSIHPW